MNAFPSISSLIYLPTASWIRTGDGMVMLMDHEMCSARMLVAFPQVFPTSKRDSCTFGHSRHSREPRREVIEMISYLDLACLDGGQARILCLFMSGLWKRSRGRQMFSQRRRRDIPIQSIQASHIHADPSPKPSDSRKRRELS